MRSIVIIFLVGVFFLNCEAQPEPTVFPEEALNDKFINNDGDAISFETILEQYKGKTILIDVWASWCRDCIVGLPGLKALQSDYQDIEYVFLSMDKSQESWKKAILKYNINGDHYFIPKGWKSKFSEAIDLDWVPRYIVVDSEGKIAMFKAIKATDPKIRKHLK